MTLKLYAFKGGKHLSLLLKIEHQLDQLSDLGIDRKFYLEKIKNYSNECGCALGAVSLIISIIFFCVYSIMYFEWNLFDFQKIALHIISGLIFIGVFTISGKLFGISISKIKLRLLYRKLIHRTDLRLLKIE